MPQQARDYSADDAVPFDAFDPNCPSRDMVDRVMGRWPSLVLVSLLEQPRRFAQTARKVGGISDRMLAQTLAHLVEDGLAERIELGDAHHVEYQLTPAGTHVARALAAAVQAVYHVAPQILAANPKLGAPRTEQVD